MVAINNNDSAASKCISVNADLGTDSLLGLPNWMGHARTVDAQLDDEFMRPSDTYSFGSPDEPPPSMPTAPAYWIDPHGRLDVQVKLESDGLYWVTRVSIEVHG